MRYPDARGVEASAIAQEAEVLGFVEGKPLLHFGAEGFEDVGGISCKVRHYLIIDPAPVAILQDLRGIQNRSLHWTGHHREEVERKKSKGPFISITALTLHILPQWNFHCPGCEN